MLASMMPTLYIQPDCLETVGLVKQIRPTNEQSDYPRESVKRRAKCRARRDRAPKSVLAVACHSKMQLSVQSRLTEQLT